LQISIIIPTLNEATNIGRLIDFLQNNEDARLLEILVIDAKSTDLTTKIAEKKGAKIYVFDQKSRAAQMNFGAKMAKGDVLYFVHADTLPPENFLDAMQDSLRKGAKMGCFCTQFDQNRWFLRLQAWFTRFSMLWCQGGDKTFFVEKELFFELGTYCERHVIMEEYDFLRRANRAGFRLDILPQKVVVSTRKYEKNHFLRVNFANFVVFNAWRFGANPARLRGIYRRLLN
jgi:rSAM/selenodomain-associated transferase 2